MCWLTRAVNDAQVRGHCERFDDRFQWARYWSRLSLLRKVSCILPQAFPFGTTVAYCAYIASCWKPREMVLLNESNSFPS
jgi:hypothetical protein